MAVTAVSGVEMNTVAPGIRQCDDWQHSCANCRSSVYVKAKNGADELICDLYNISFGFTSDDIDPMDGVAAITTCNSFRR